MRSPRRACLLHCSTRKNAASCKKRVGVNWVSSYYASRWRGYNCRVTESRLKVFFRVLAIALGSAETIAARNSTGPDSRSYLEVARAYLRHDWAMAVNAYWSPLYSWLSAIVLGVTHPSWRWEYPTIHAMNFMIYLAAIAAFEFFWRGIQRSESGVPNLILWVLGYSLFIWLTVGYLSMTGPDLCVETITLLIAGLVVRIKNNEETKHFVWLGITLAVGYFAKAVLFPMAFVFLGVLLMARVPPRKIAWTAVIFLVLSAPLILLLSREKHHLTFSESGPLTLAWSNWNIPIRNWQGQPAGSGTPIHPTRQIHQHPAVFEFNGPIRASYPPWYDPSYWNEGLRFRFDAGVVLKHAAHNLTRILSYFLQPKVWILAIFVLAALSSRSSFAGIATDWFLLLPAIAAFAMYSLTFAESRYMPAWEMLVWAAFLFGLRIRKEPAKRILPWLAGGTAAVMLLSSANGVRAEFVYGRHDDATSEYRIAEELQQLGVSEGEKVAAIGFDNDAHWAYLDRLSIIAEIDADQTCEFWSAIPATQQEILNEFRHAGASLVVARVNSGMRSTSSANPPDLAACAHPSAGWEKLPDGNLVYLLK